MALSLAKVSGCREGRRIKPESWWDKQALHNWLVLMPGWHVTGSGEESRRNEAQPTCWVCVLGQSVASQCKPAVLDMAGNSGSSTVPRRLCGAVVGHKEG